MICFLGRSRTQRLKMRSGRRFVFSTRRDMGSFVLQVSIHPRFIGQGNQTCDKCFARSRGRKCVYLCSRSLYYVFLFLSAISDINTSIISCTDRKEKLLHDKATADRDYERDILHAIHMIMQSVLSGYSSLIEFLGNLHAIYILYNYAKEDARRENSVSRLDL